MCERFDGRLGLGFLHIAEHSIDNQDQDDHDGVERQHFAAFRAGLRIGFFDEPSDHRDNSGRDQQVDQRILELGQEFLPFRYGRGAGELVRAEFGQSALGFFLAQAVGWVDVQGFGHVVGAGQTWISIPQ